MDKEIKEMTTEELERKLDEKKYVIVDVREDDEVAKGMIPGAIHIPLGSIPEKLDEFHKDNEYVMVCRSGGRSHRASLFLQENGYKDYNLKGGMLEWKGEKEF